MTTTPPTCFLSYAWADAAHQEWVQKLAADLMKNGVYTYLDQWDLKPGTDLPRFMELVGKSDWIGLVCTPEYRAKSELRRGGVGYESQLITRVLFEQVGTERASHVLPLLRKGTSAESVPAFLPAALYLDFRDDAHYESALEQLLRRIFDAPRDARPRLGAPPTSSPARARKTSSPRPSTRRASCSGTCSRRRASGSSRAAGPASIGWSRAPSRRPSTSRTGRSSSRSHR